MEAIPCMYITTHKDQYVCNLKTDDNWVHI